jgi:toxin ParE1/3/4
MALAVAFTEEARTQLQELESYLADRFDPGNARKYMDRLMQFCLGLGGAPHRGRRREDLRPNVRVIGFERKASIYFKVEGQTVFVLGVLYGGRTFESPE